MKSTSRTLVLRFGVFPLAIFACLLMIFGASQQTVVASGNSTETEPTAIPNELLGNWTVSYHPNEAVRQYEFRKDRTVAFVGHDSWSGSLVPYVAPASELVVKGRWKLTFDGDAAERFELITWTADGRILVEHYNPAATQLPKFDQIGLGIRSASR